MQPPIDKCPICDRQLDLSEGTSDNEMSYFCLFLCYTAIKYINGDVRYARVYLKNIDIRAIFRFNEDRFYFLDHRAKRIPSNSIHIPTINWNNKNEIINKLNSLLMFL
jgi:hypothetical protein